MLRGNILLDERPEENGPHQAAPQAVEQQLPQDWHSCNEQTDYMHLKLYSNTVNTNVCKHCMSNVHSIECSPQDIYSKPLSISSKSRPDDHSQAATALPVHSTSLQYDRRSSISAKQDSNEAGACGLVTSHDDNSRSSTCHTKRRRKKFVYTPFM